MLFILGGYTAELQPADISIQQPLRHSIKQQAMQFSWRTRFCMPAQRSKKKNEHHNESLAPPLLDIRRGTEACGESHSRAPQWHTLEESPEETDLILHDDDDDDNAEDPGTKGTAVAEASEVVAEASERFPTVAAEVARAERFLYLRCAYGKHPPKP